MRIDLTVPFEEKDQAKKLGARWDAARKVWYIENKEDLELFMRWIPQRLTKPYGASNGTRGAEVNAPRIGRATLAVVPPILVPIASVQAGRDYKPFDTLQLQRIALGAVPGVSGAGGMACEQTVMVGVNYLGRPH